MRLSSNLKSFQFLIVLLKFFGISKYKPPKIVYVDYAIRFYSCSLMLSYIWLTYFNMFINMLELQDPITKYVLLIDRTFVVVVATGLFSDAIFRQWNNSKLIENFDRIDHSLSLNFGIKMNYDLMLRINVFVFLGIVSILMTSLRFYLANQNLGLYGIFSFFFMGIFMIYTVKSFYLTLIIQLSIRLESINKFLIEKPDKFIENNKFIFEELFMSFYDLIEIFNESFSFNILLIISEFK